VLLAAPASTDRPAIIPAPQGRGKYETHRFAISELALLGLLKITTVNTKVPGSIVIAQRHAVALTPLGDVLVARFGRGLGRRQDRKCKPIRWTLERQALAAAVRLPLDRLLEVFRDALIVARSFERESLEWATRIGRVETDDQLHALEAVLRAVDSRLPVTF
jgi:hypothetical protein